MVEEFHYRVFWKARSTRPGHHRGRDVSGGLEFHRYAYLLDSPDPRRVDVRMSLRDPFEQIFVRIYEQKSAISVYALADLSASMAVTAQIRKLDVLADFVTSLGYSAYRTGDWFGFIGCDQTICQDFYQPLTRAKSAGPVLGSQLRRFSPSGAGSEGLLEAARLITAQRALVFLISDYYFPFALLDQILDVLSRHMVVPIVVTDGAETNALRAFGIANFIDSETGHRRTLLMRPTLRDKIRLRYEKWRSELEQTCQKHDFVPLWMENGFRCDEVTRYFFE